MKKVEEYLKINKIEYFNSYDFTRIYRKEDLERRIANGCLL